MLVLSDSVKGATYLSLEFVFLRRTGARAPDIGVPRAGNRSAIQFRRLLPLIRQRLRHEFADLRADHLAGNDDDHAAILLTPLGGVVGCDRI
jgi:hypothetical protein